MHTKLIYWFLMLFITSLFSLGCWSRSVPAFNTVKLAVAESHGPLDGPDFVAINKDLQFRVCKGYADKYGGLVLVVEWKDDRNFEQLQIDNMWQVFLLHAELDGIEILGSDDNLIERRDIKLGGDLGPRVSVADFIPFAMPRYYEEHDFFKVRNKVIGFTAGYVGIVGIAINPKFSETTIKVRCRPVLWSAFGLKSNADPIFDIIVLKVGDDGIIREE